MVVSRSWHKSRVDYYLPSALALLPRTVAAILSSLLLLDGVGECCFGRCIGRRCTREYITLGSRVRVSIRDAKKPLSFIGLLNLVSLFGMRGKSIAAKSGRPDVGLTLNSEFYR